MAPPKIRIESPLGTGALLLRRLRGREQLGRLFSYDVELLAPKPIAKLSSLLGEELTVVLELPAARERFFGGHVTEIEATGVFSRFHSYKLVLRPWFWFLTRTTNCRIFQRMTVPEIISQIFRERGFSDVEDALNESYPTCEYSVQYRESEFDFLSRLMEREGIYYYFKHEHGKHTLVLADGQASHRAIPGYESVPVVPPQKAAPHERDHIEAWTTAQNIQSGAYILNDFDYKRPKANLEVKLASPRSHARDDYERYDYPGGFVQTRDGEMYVRARLEELHAQFESFHGTGNVRGLHPGALFELARSPTTAFNQEYLVSSASYELDGGEYDSTGTATGSTLFRCELQAITSRTPHRPERRTPKPVVHGPQTAIVVGKSGEEIWTDEFGRVKVQFHWDREGARDQNSSCWVRVSQTMAGAGWGAMHVPRLGQEVVVSFLEGDPDQPLITGRVYNGNNKPPFDLPQAGMVSGIKTDTTPGGSGYNELSMDDTKGKEKVILHAQHDMATTVEHDQFLTVKNNRTAKVDVDDLEQVGKNQTVLVKQHQKLTVEGDQTAAVQGKRTETVDGNFDLSAHAKLTVKVDGEIAIKGDRKGVIEISDELTIKVGAAQITLKQNGDITLKGTNLTLKGSGNVVLKGSKISQN